MHGERLAAALVAPGGAVQQAQAGLEGDGAVAAGFELVNGLVAAAGLAEHLAVCRHGNLIRADDQGARVLLGHCACLFPRQAQHQFHRRLAGPAGFVDIRAVAAERQPQALQQAAPERGGRGQNEGRGGGCHGGSGRGFTPGLSQCNATVLTLH